MKTFYPSLPTKSSTLKWVYRLNICTVSWPVIEATSISPKPFSKSLEVASWRKSWKVRPSMPAPLQPLQLPVPRVE